MKSSEFINVLLLISNLVSPSRSTDGSKAISDQKSTVSNSAPFSVRSNRAFSPADTIGVSLIPGQISSVIARTINNELLKLGVPLSQRLVISTSVADSLTSTQTSMSQAVPLIITELFKKLIGIGLIDLNRFGQIQSATITDNHSKGAFKDTDLPDSGESLLFRDILVDNSYVSSGSSNDQTNSSEIVSSPVDTFAVTFTPRQVSSVIDPIMSELLKLGLPLSVSLAISTAVADSLSSSQTLSQAVTHIITGFLMTLSASGLLTVKGLV